MGNLDSCEYRQLLKNDRLLIIVDKPLTRVLPELYEENKDVIVQNKTQYKLKRNKPIVQNSIAESFCN